MISMPNGLRPANRRRLEMRKLQVVILFLGMFAVSNLITGVAVWWSTKASVKASYEQQIADVKTEQAEALSRLSATRSKLEVLHGTEIKRLRQSQQSCDAVPLDPVSDSILRAASIRPPK